MLIVLNQQGPTLGVQSHLSFHPTKHMGYVGEHKHLK